MEITEEEQEQTLSKKGVKAQVWRAKSKVGDEQNSRSSTAPINMVFIIPKEFMAQNDQDKEPDLGEAMAQLNLEPVLATFEKS